MRNSIDEYFDDEKGASNLRKKTIRAGKNVAIFQAYKFVFRVVTTVILSRLLLPDDFGLVAMGAVFINFAALFKDAGLSKATIQRKALSRESASSMFWLNAAISLVLCLCLMLSSPAVSAFYGDDRLQQILLVLSVSLFISGVGLQHRALLQRSMMFGRLALIDVLAITLGFIITLGLALSGVGVWALVANQIAVPTITLAGLYCAVRWMPGRFSWTRDTAEMLKFGANFTGFNVINFLSRSMDNLLIGRYCGSETLGFYNRSYGLMMLPIQQLNGPISAVLVPAMSKVQDRPERYKATYLKAVSLVAWLTMPTMAIASFLGEEFIVIFLGEPWRPSGSIFEWLAVACIFQPTIGLLGVLNISSGRVDRMFKFSCIGAAVTIIGFIIGIRYGALGVAMSFAFTNILLMSPRVWFYLSVGDIRPHEFFKVMIMPLGLAFILYVVGLSYF